MKIKLLTGNSKGTIHDARILRKTILDPSPSFQITKGRLMGVIVRYSDCLVVTDAEDEKVYSRKQWKDMKNRYTKKLEEKNKEVNDLLKERNMLLRVIDSFTREHYVANEVSRMLDAWLDSPYEGNEKDDIRRFSIKLTKFIKEKLA